jgi:hypothetical protein
VNSAITNSVLAKIQAYKPKGGLDHTALLFLALSSINHREVKKHAERVALLSEATARQLKLDTKASFFSGLLHDLGKLVLPAELFQEKEITAREYEKIKAHALAAFKILQQLHPFVALCAGLHHALYEKGYGLTMKDFSKKWPPNMVKKILEIATIVSVCDFIDAATHRKTHLRQKTEDKNKTLRQKLLEKYPDNILIVETALKANAGKI